MTCHVMLPFLGGGEISEVGKIAKIAQLAKASAISFPTNPLWDLINLTSTRTP